MPSPAAELVHSLVNDRGSDLVRYIASRLPCGEDARDLAQEAYIRLLRLEKPDLVRHPEAYLFRIASNLIYEDWLKRKPEQESVRTRVDSDSVASPAASSESAASHCQSLEALSRILRVLPPMQRRVVLLHRRDGLTYAEIAGELGTTPDMVKKYLAKGLARCREQMARYYDDGCP